ncbi:MAG: hypothetical protein ACLGG3_04620, partial [Alphaproteobacteria bacterium]
MRVRIMTWLPAAAGFLALSAAADEASAQCGPVCPPPPPPCCGGGGGNLNVNVNVNANANADAGARARVGLNARAGGSVWVSGGGSAYVTVDQPSPTTISGLNVEGARMHRTIRV